MPEPLDPFGALGAVRAGRRDGPAGCTPCRPWSGPGSAACRGCRSASASSSNRCCATATASGSTSGTSAGSPPGGHEADREAEIPFVVARIVLQDFTGVPLLVDLAAMRSAVARLGKDPAIIEPLVPVDLVVDHSVQVDFSEPATTRCG